MGRSFCINFKSYHFTHRFVSIQLDLCMPLIPIQYPIWKKQQCLYMKWNVANVEKCLQESDNVCNANPDFFITTRNKFILFFWKLPDNRMSEKYIQYLYQTWVIELIDVRFLIKLVYINRYNQWIIYIDYYW